MKYINKRIQNEPDILRIYRNTTGNATYKGFGDVGSLLKLALLHEQGHLCGYCMKRLNKPAECSVEHYISQEAHLDSRYNEAYHLQQQLIYTNMLAVCKNDGKHCDKSRGNIPFKVLNPHQRSCEQLIHYTIDGKIESNQNENVDADIEMLKLNCQLVKDSRNEFWEKAKDQLKAKHPKGNWNRAILEAEMQQYIDRLHDKFAAYRNYIIYHFNRLMNLPRYNI